MTRCLERATHVHARPPIEFAQRLLVASVVLWCSVTARAITLTVDSNDDTIDALPGNGVCADATGHCTLRAAIQEANLLSGADTIVLPAGTYTLTLQGRGEDEGATGDLDVIGDLTITGAGAATTIIDGGSVDRVFDNTAGLDIAGVTIRNGSSGSATEGGGIQNYGVLTLTDVTLAANTAGSGGGGLENALTATLERVTVSGNHAGFTGGGIKNDGTVTLTNVTLSGNQAGTGGGAIESADTVTLTNVTVGGNTGGGLDNMGTATLKDTLVAGSSPNCAGGVDSSGHNLDSANTCGLTGTGDLHDVDPLLGPLQDNGGPTLTRALGAGSPAIDAGSGDCPPPGTDQRGVTRPVDGVCDIGAFEFEPSATTTTVGGGSTTSTSSTTTTLPGCAVAPTLQSIDCRLAQLMAEVQASVPAGPVHDALAKQLTNAMTRTGQGAQAIAEGNAKRAKKALAKGAKALKKFGGRLGTRKARKVVDPAVATELQATAAQTRTDIRTLRGTL